MCDKLILSDCEDKKELYAEFTNLKSFETPFSVKQL